VPELPEVETIKRDLAKILVGLKINQVKITWAKTIAPLSPAIFQRKIAGTKITAIERRAKMIRIKLSGPLDLLIHLKMTGQLIYQPQIGKIVVGGHPQPGGLINLPNSFTRVILSFTNDSKLFFNDLRKFGWIRLADDKTIKTLFAKNGPEPLSKDFSLLVFQQILARFPRRPIKQILLDQTLIAGLGNIYVDEACFNAKILPTRKTSTLKPKEITKLHQAIIAILKLSISKKGTSSRNYVRADGSQGGFVPYLNVYGRSKETCKVCKQPIQKIKFVGRGTHFCKYCQK